MKNLSSVKKRIWPMLLALSMVLGILGVYIYGDGLNTRAGDVSDARYQVIYDKFEELGRTPPMAPSEVYEKYGTMNGDYYVIAMEENLMRLNGNTDVRATDLIVVNDNLKKSGALPLDLRRSLREDVETYGLDCNLPDDPGFSYSGMEVPTHSETPTPTASPATTPVPTETTTPTTITFADVTPDAWYYDAVETLAQSGFLKGYDDGLFHPNDELTIGQWCTIVWRVVGGKIGSADGGTVERYDGKVAPHWAALAVNRCRTYGFTKFGPTFDPAEHGGSFYEDLLAERGEAVTAVVKIVEDTNLESTLQTRVNEQGMRSWGQEDIPDWAVIEQNVDPSYTDRFGPVFYNTHWWNPDSILKAYNYGIIQGVDSIGTCNPIGVLTRAQACQMLYNAMITSPRPIQGHGGIF